jgi:AhpD family alkylhydroperoxidase
MTDDVFPKATPELATKRRKLAPDTFAAWREFSKAVFAEGELPSVTKQLIAVAVAHSTQCPYCIKGHTKEALRQGATQEQIMEAIWVAAEMRAGGAYAHSIIALNEMPEAAETAD